MYWHMDMIKKSYIIPDKMDIEIKKLAAEEHLSQSELVIKAVGDYLKNNHDRP